MSGGFLFFLLAVGLLVGIVVVGVARRPRPWYCLDCGRRGLRPGSNPAITFLLCLPALWAFWTALAAGATIPDAPPSGPAFGAAFWLMGRLLLGLLLLAIPAVYGSIAGRKRCALCGGRRIIPADSPAARAALESH